MQVMTTRGVSTISAQEAFALCAGDNTLVLDVRSGGEFGGGHLRGARLIPVSELSSRIDEIQTFRDKPVIVYCLSGGRSATACRILIQNGFGHVNNVAGGISAWSQQGLEVVS